MGLTLTVTLAALIGAIAALHFSWAFGVDWPAPSSSHWASGKSQASRNNA